MTKANVKITYVEFGSRGHQPLWIDSLIKALNGINDKPLMNFWITEDFTKHHGGWFSNHFKQSQLDSEQLNFKLIEEVARPVTALSRLEVIRRCMEADGADAGFVGLNLDACLKEIALSMPGKFPGKLVGVLSQPFLHYGLFSSAKNLRWLTWRRKIPAFIKLFLACRRHFIGEILTLDPYAPNYYNKKFLTSKFRFLHEPLLSIQPFPQPRKFFQLPENRCVLLFPGNIDRRKGIVEFLIGVNQALKESPRLRKELAIVIAGQVMPEIKDQFSRLTADFQLDYPDVPLKIYDSYVSDEEFISLIEASDCICMPYRNFVGSSGILVHAAANNRLVLASEFGLIGELVKRYNLGIVCDESDPINLVKALISIVQEWRSNNVTKTEGMKTFTSKYAVSLEQFGAEICASLLRVVNCKV